MSDFLTTHRDHLVQFSVFGQLVITTIVTSVFQLSRSLFPPFVFGDILWISGTCIVVQMTFPSVNSIKAVKETQSSVVNLWPSFILYSSITRLLKEPVVAVALILMLYLETDRNTHPFNGPFPGLPR